LRVYIPPTRAPHTFHLLCETPTPPFFFSLSRLNTSNAAFETLPRLPGLFHSIPFLHTSPLPFGPFHHLFPSLYPKVFNPTPCPFSFKGRFFPTPSPNQNICESLFFKEFPPERPWSENPQRTIPIVSPFPLPPSLQTTVLPTDPQEVGLGTQTGPFPLFSTSSI